MERLLIYGNIIGSLIYGWQQQALWLAVPFVSFAAFVIIHDRQLRLRIGPRHWPSEGFARFSMGTNLFVMLWNSFLNTVLFLAAGTARALAGL
ncbi:MAG: hypothetical protein ACYC0C_01690 [Devosia sp.]